MPRLIALLRYMRELDDSISLHQLETFLIIANAGENGTTMRNVEALMKCPNATLSRNVSYWSKWRKQGVPGMDFIVSEIDPSDRRYRIVKLTPKGRAVFTEMKRIMGEE